MKFIPMLYSTPMVQAIEENRKTKTRRTKGLENVIDIAPNPNAANWWIDQDGNAISCPYGKPGDVIWVRESFYQPISEQINSKYFYKADIQKQGWNFKWKPNIHMPKAAARHFLKIKSITVEKLQDITEADAVSEGVEKNVAYYHKPFKKELIYRDYTLKTTGCLDSRSSFMTMWICINGEESWKANPFVWVIEFERIEKPINFC